MGELQDSPAVHALPGKPLIPRLSQRLPHEPVLWPPQDPINLLRLERTMQNIITIGRKHVPLVHIVLVEPFEPSMNSEFKPEKDFKARLVLLNRETVLSESSPREIAETHGFPVLAEDNVATNPNITDLRFDRRLQAHQALRHPPQMAGSRGQGVQQTPAHQAGGCDCRRVARHVGVLRTQAAASWRATAGSPSARSSSRRSLTRRRESFKVAIHRGRRLTSMRLVATDRTRVR
jgi:hypothetical protein